MKRPERIEGAIIHRNGAFLRSAKQRCRSRAPPALDFSAVALKSQWRLHLPCAGKPATPLRARHSEQLATASYSSHRA